MPTESDDRDVNEGDDTEETGGLSKKQNAHMENSEKANWRIAKRQTLCLNVGLNV